MAYVHEACCAFVKITARQVSQGKTFLSLILTTPQTCRLSVNLNESVQHKLQQARKLYIGHRRKQRFKQTQSPCKSSQSVGRKHQIPNEVMRKVGGAG